MARWDRRQPWRTRPRFRPGRGKCRPRGRAGNKAGYANPGCGRPRLRAAGPARGPGSGGREAIQAPLGRRDNAQQAEFLLVSMDTYQATGGLPMDRGGLAGTLVVVTLLCRRASPQRRECGFPLLLAPARLTTTSAVRRRPRSSRALPCRATSPRRSTSTSRRPSRTSTPPAPTPRRTPRSPTRRSPRCSPPRCTRTCACCSRARSPTSSAAPSMASPTTLRCSLQSPAMSLAEPFGLVT